MHVVVTLRQHQDLLKEYGNIRGKGVGKGNSPDKKMKHSEEHAEKISVGINSIFTVTL